MRDQIQLLKIDMAHLFVFSKLYEEMSRASMKEKVTAFVDSDQLLFFSKDFPATYKQLLAQAGFATNAKNSDESVVKQLLTALQDKGYLPKDRSLESTWYQTHSEKTYPCAQEGHLKSWSATEAKLAAEYESRLIVGAAPITEGRILATRPFDIENTPAYKKTHQEHIGQFIDMLFQENIKTIFAVGKFGSDFPEYFSHEDNQYFCQRDGDQFVIKSKANEVSKTIQLVNLEIIDGHPLNLSKEEFKSVYDSVQAFKKSNHNVYMHCASGVGRSGSLAFLFALLLDEKIVGLVRSAVDQDQRLDTKEYQSLLNLCDQTLRHLRSRRHTIQELPQMYRAIDLLLDYLRYEKALAENDEASFALSFNTELDAVITGEVKKVGYPSLAVQQIAQEQNILSLYSGISAAARAAVAVLADIPKSGLDLDGKSFNKLNEIATKLKEIDANHFLEENEKTLDKILELFNLVPTSQYQYIANLQEHLTALVNQIKPEEQAKLIAERLELLKEINRPDLLAFREYLAKDAVRGSAQSARAAFIEGLFSEIRNPTLRQSLDNKQIDIYRVLLPVLFLVCNAEANNPLDPILREMLRGFNVTEESIANRFSGTEVNTYFAQLQKNIFTIEQTADFSQRKSAGLFSAKHNSALIDFYLSNLTRFYQLQLDMAELTDADTQLVAELTTELTGLMSKYLSGESDQNAIQSLSDDYFRFIEDRLNPAFTDPKKALSIKPFLPFIQGELRYIKDNFRIQPTQCPDAVVVARQADEKAKCVIS